MAAKSVDIKQESDLLAKKNDTTKIKCRHNDNSMLNMLWYQRKDTAMNLIVYNYGAEGKPVYEDDLENHFQMKRQDILNGALTISDLRLSDSAVYYCAVRKIRCVYVQQKFELFANENGPAEIKCSHNDNGMPYMLWYRQKSTAMDLIVFSYGATSDPSYENGFTVGFQLKRHETLNAVLVISNLNLSDSAVYYCAVNFSDGVLITQWPKYITSFPGSTMQMHCYQNDTNYDYKYWYRQRDGEGPVLIASYVVNTPTYEKDFGTGFTASGSEKKKWTLMVEVKKESDAVYLCAASLHSD
ncbi:hypothetical protein IRJ41_019302 [Triplophysa rosa]|uniref:Ig-like domain-containing protein n=1 Tax=Triplophysa rosa TaxID=992332 RepID=A0A9W7T417_TRIRA|nr:hypothetical protein IRJ41_019302 [Triplophysa rosa]